MPTATELPGVIDTTKEQGRSQEFVSEGDKRVGSATAPAGYRALGGVWGKAPETRKLCLKFDWMSKIPYCSEKIFFTVAISEGDMPPLLLPYAPAEEQHHGCQTVNNRRCIAPKLNGCCYKFSLTNSFWRFPLPKEIVGNLCLFVDVRAVNFSRVRYSLLYKFLTACHITVNDL